MALPFLAAELFVELHCLVEHFLCLVQFAAHAVDIPQVAEGGRHAFLVAELFVELESFVVRLLGLAQIVANCVDIPQVAEDGGLCLRIVGAVGQFEDSLISGCGVIEISAKSMYPTGHINCAHVIGSDSQYVVQGSQGRIDVALRVGD